MLKKKEIEFCGLGNLFYLPIDPRYLSTLLKKAHLECEEWCYN
jgi:hypothetical protein